VVLSELEVLEDEEEVVLSELEVLEGEVVVVVLASVKLVSEG
jgi:hypothetical protein